MDDYILAIWMLVSFLLGFVPALLAGVVSNRYLQRRLGDCAERLRDIEGAVVEAKVQLARQDPSGVAYSDTKTSHEEQNDG